ncbi:MAG TPA: hypothetical protein VFX98_11340 [Longimicrobiaceae bacterium]|nr:hypothetical protein [Longimicrobiaceae bacterium]
MRRFLLALAAALALAAPARAQEGGDGWNSPRALELVARAQDRRARTQADTGMADYQADARGYIYFYLDRRDTGERTLVKTDQVALDVYWKAPAFSKQRIIGLRDAKKLPTTIRYHEDHLTVVQDNFGDLIRLGDGDEVRDVLHPAASGGPGFYDYRLSDSLSIRLPGSDEPVRVYELEVRPRDLSRPAFVGTVYVDRRQGDIVRMNFTFTSSSYVDRQLDYINVSLENGLWKGRFWLPNQQQLELRRQLPELGFPAGGVIRGTMRITNYRFNQNLPASFFAGRRVISVPEAQRRRFAFEQPLDAELREQGIGPDTELGEIRRQAAELIRRRMLSGLPGTRVDVPAASGIARYNRAEGLAVGFGVRSRAGERLTLGLRGGWAFGPMHPVAVGEATLVRPGFRLDARGYAFEPRDVGVGPAVSGAVNTLTGLLAGHDFTDLYYAGGAEARLAGAVGRGWEGALRLRAEEHESAALESDFSFSGSGEFRPVSPVDEGTMVGGGIALVRGLPSGVARGWTATVGVEGGRLLRDGAGDDPGFVKPRAEVGLVRRWPWREAALEASVAGGAAFGTLPRQELYLLGGRGTVPGYAFRAFGGDRFALLRATASAELESPYLRGRLLAAAGWADAGAAGEDALLLWPAATARDPFVSVGVGVGIFYDILRVDLARGLGSGGGWELIVEANPSFWDFL